MRKPNMTISELQDSMFDKVASALGVKCHISHGACCWCGTTKLYGHHTNIYVPHDHPSKPARISRLAAAIASETINDYYCPVVRHVVVRGVTVLGNTSYRVIRCYHE